MFDRWCASKKVEKDYEKLRQLVLIEEFKNCVHKDVRTFIDEQKVESLESAARLADEFDLNHKESFEISTPRPSRNYATGKRFSRGSDIDKRAAGYSKEGSPLSKPLVCNYCKKDGHLLSDCFKLKRKQSQNNSKPSGFVSSSRSLPCSDVLCNDVVSPFDAVKVMPKTSDESC